MKRAFSLTEVLLAAAVLLGAMVPVLFMFPSGARRTAFGEAQLRAHLRAEAMLAQAVDVGLRTGFRHLPEGEALPLAGARKGVESIRYDKVPGYPGLWIVTASVDWEPPAGIGGVNRTYTLERLVHRPDLGLAGEWPLVTPATEMDE